MWVFFPNAALSIVAHRELPSELLVRARIRADLKRFLPPELERCIVHTPKADYAYRAVVPRDVVARRMADAVRRMPYPNVKAAVTQNDRHRLYARIWRLVLEFAEDRRIRRRLLGDALSPL